MFLLVSTILFSEESQNQEALKEKPQKKSVLVYPKELLKPLPEMDLSELKGANEVVEVESTKYPALNFQLPTLEQRLQIETYEWQPPLPGPEFYQRGGGIMALYGVREPSSQLFSAPISLDAEEESEKKEED
jgi:hypothetical protein